jgi:hypothetical protein
MENSDSNPKQNTTPVENNYSAHKENPAPAPEAVFEEDKRGAGQVLRWIIPVLVVILLIVWFFFKG